MRLIKRQEKAFGRVIPFAILFTRTSAAIRPRTLASIEAEFVANEVPVLVTQIHERDAFKAVFAFGGGIATLDPAQVTNLKAAMTNARAFTSEVINTLKTKPVRQAEEVV